MKSASSTSQNLTSMLQTGLPVLVPPGWWRKRAGRPIQDSRDAIYVDGFGMLH